MCLWIFRGLCCPLQLLAPLVGSSVIVANLQLEWTEDFLLCETPPWQVQGIDLGCTFLLALEQSDHIHLSYRQNCGRLLLDMVTERQDEQ